MIFLKKTKFFFKFSSDFNFFMSNKNFYIFGPFGFFVFFLPSYLYYFNVVYCFFFSKKIFKNFLYLCFLGYKQVIIFYFLRLKLKGLGFFVGKFCYNLFYFFFAFSTFFYFYIPKDILFKVRRRKKIYLFGNKLFLLNLVYKQLLLLKKLDPYKLKGLLKKPRHLIFLRKKSKAGIGNF